MSVCFLLPWRLRIRTQVVFLFFLTFSYSSQLPFISSSHFLWLISLFLSQCDIMPLLFFPSAPLHIVFAISPPFFCSSLLYYFLLWCPSHSEVIYLFAYQRLPLGNSHNLSRSKWASALSSVPFVEVKAVLAHSFETLLWTFFFSDQRLHLKWPLFTSSRQGPLVAMSALVRAVYFCMGSHLELKFVKSIFHDKQNTWSIRQHRPRLAVGGFYKPLPPPG